MKSEGGVVFLTLLAFSGCARVAGLEELSFEEDSASASDTDTDTDTDTDIDTDTDTDTNTQPDTGTDTGSDTDTATSPVGDTDTSTTTSTDSETGTPCIPNAAIQCNPDTGDVHSYDSCGIDEGVVVDCHDTNGNCTNTSTTAAECGCLGNWDGDNACDTCITGFTDNGDNCAHAVRYVDPAVAGLTGISWSEALADVQSGIGECSATLTSGDVPICEVWVRAGAYYVYYSNPSNTVNLMPGVEVYGGFTGTEQFRSQRDYESNPTILDGRDSSDGTNGVYHVLTSEVGGLLDGFVIQNAKGGSEEPNGGGLWVKEDASPTVRNCIFQNNTSYLQGGAIYASAGSSATIDYCEFIDNQASTNGGGAICNEDNTTTVVTRSSFTDNTTYDGMGGAIKNKNAELIKISDCTFDSNFADQGGGGVSNVSSTVEITGCTFENNNSTDTGGEAVYSSSSTVSISRSTFKNHQHSASGSSGTAKGGALYNTGSEMTITGSVFFDNAATGMEGYGGAIYQTAGSLVVYNCTFNQNEVYGDDGADYTKGAALYMAGVVATVRNTIIYGNIPTTDQYNHDTTGNLLIYYSDVEGIDTTYNNNVDADPLFLDETAGDLHIGDNSICIDAADGNYAPAWDRDGKTRVNHPTIPNTGTGTPNYTDIGAYEFQI